MGTVVHKLTKKEMKLPFIFSCCVGAVFFVSGCQKSPAPEAVPEPTNVASGAVTDANSSAPTGLVKNPTRHTEQTANVTKWWDIAETKTAAQTARDEKIAKEAKELKLAQEVAKQAQEAKILAAKTAAVVREPVKVAPTIAPQAPVVVKAVEVAPAPAPAVAKTAPAPAAAEQDVLKFLSGSQPVFPIAAAKAGLSQGSVSARLFVEKNGSVSKVEIIDAKPRKYFDREVIAALSAWKYAPISNPQTKTVEINFKADN